jgi:uncharacterized repeat protein (TIGR03833 family)
MPRYSPAGPSRLLAVPSVAEVQPGATVNIVLKADQPTGRTVAGVVEDLLTRGNHPRGIKVRLTDGRIGRVQSIASPSGSTEKREAETEGEGELVDGAGAASADATRDDEDSNVRQFTVKRHGDFSGRLQSRFSDMRLDDEPEKPAEQIGLDAYIKPAKPKKQGRGKKRPADGTEAPSDQLGNGSTVVGEQGDVPCPVCGDFKGDAAAVEHHVAGHFDA